jgi:hypothetical protein
VRGESVKNPNGRALAQFGSTVASDAERIGKKPNEADLSYTAVCTGLSDIFISDRKIGKKAKRAKGDLRTLDSRRRNRREGLLWEMRMNKEYQQF